MSICLATGYVCPRDPTSGSMVLKGWRSTTRLPSRSILSRWQVFKLEIRLRFLRNLDLRTRPRPVAFVHLRVPEPPSPSNPARYTPRRRCSPISRAIAWSYIEGGGAQRRRIIEGAQKFSADWWPRRRATPRRRPRRGHQKAAIVAIAFAEERHGRGRTAR